MCRCWWKSWTFSLHFRRTHGKLVLVGTSWTWLWTWSVRPSFGHATLEESSCLALLYSLDQMTYLYTFLPFILSSFLLFCLLPSSSRGLLFLCVFFFFAWSSWCLHVFTCASSFVFLHTSHTPSPHTPRDTLTPLAGLARSLVTTQSSLRRRITSHSKYNRLVTTFYTKHWTIRCRWLHYYRWWW